MAYIWRQHQVKCNQKVFHDIFTMGLEYAQVSFLERMWIMLRSFGLDALFCDVWSIVFNALIICLIMEVLYYTTLCQRPNRPVLDKMLWSLNIQKAYSCPSWHFKCCQKKTSKLAYSKDISKSLFEFLVGKLQWDDIEDRNTVLFIALCFDMDKSLKFCLSYCFLTWTGHLRGVNEFGFIR